MSYQVIARKYRPQTFADLTGQEHITRTLKNAIDQQRLHHAYLFSGPRGTGKTTTARILAKALNCQTAVTSTPCLQCASCLEIAISSSMDVLEIDAASNTGVDNVRDVIINNIAIAPARDRYKIFIIDEVHMLSTSAFNALLKTLEEPPAHVVFIMATTELHKVPDTILSRCQQFEFRYIATEKIFGRLREIAVAEQVAISDEALREIARAGAGSLRDAQSALDQVIAFSGNRITEEDVAAALGLVSARTLGRFAEAIAAQDTTAILNLVEELVSRGYDLRNFARELMAYFRHLLVVKSGIVSGEMLGVADVEVERLKQLATLFSEEDLVRFFHLLAETEKGMKDSPHPRFQLEIGLIKLTQAARLRTLAELIARLEALEAKLSEGTSSTRGGTSPPVANSSHPDQPGADMCQKSLAQPAESRSQFDEAAGSPAESLSSSPPFEELSDFSDYDPFARPEANLVPSLNSMRDEDQPGTESATTLALKVEPGREIKAIRAELERLNRGLLLTALEDAQSLEFANGKLIATFAREDVFAKRVRASGTIFREIGERLFGTPIRVVVNIGQQPEVARLDEISSPHDQLRERALNNPAVRAIMEKFRAKLVNVEELSSPSR